MPRADDTQLIDSFEEFYRSYYRNEIAELAQKYPDEQKSLYIDWQDLYRFDSDLSQDFHNKPDQLRQYAEEALRLYDLPVDVSLGQAHVRVRNLPATTEIGELNSDHRGKLIAVQGSVKKATAVESKITTAAFECQRCGTLTRIPQEGEDFQDPHECQGCERQGPFRINYDQSEFIDAQTLEIQSPVRGLRDQDPERIQVHIEDDITGTVSLGDRVEVTGIVKLDQKGSERNRSSRFGMYLEGLTVDETETEYGHVQITDAEKKEIVELSNQSNLYEQIIGSIAPTVHNHETGKSILAHQLFSGVTKFFPDGSQTRGNIHSLFVADSGTYQTIKEMIERAAELSPRAVKASGAETSGTGLTTTAYPSSNSSGGSPWEIEAGPLIEADLGHAFVTDFDDLGKEAESSVETVLREQSIDASKATESVSLPARTSVFGVTTPVYGRFDDFEPLAEQIPLSGEVTGAFDLVVLISDNPNKSNDEEAASHILKASRAGEVNRQAEQSEVSNYTEEEVETLNSEIESEIETDLLRKYIAYARRNCYPTMTEEAESSIQEYYVETRSQCADSDLPTPVTEEVLDTLVRLSEASARMRLSDRITEGDAERAIGIVETYLKQVGVPETGELDADMIETATDGNNVDDLDFQDWLANLIATIENEYDEGAPVDVIVERAEEQGADAHKVEEGISELKVDGEVYEPRNNHLRTT
ncbi:minichromosome maintenance protein MCM [Halovenus sp. HT40]|uniref:minichromosome maintenance protein MCM n=1 Tax=Halovenus sp. HT40 TaxID=3126691 RepID=UPI00300F6604